MVSSHHPQRVLLVAPRFHTNQVPVVKALIDAGHEVAFFSLFQGPTEWHKLLQPTIFGRSWITKIAYRALRLKDTFRFDLRYALPEMQKFLRDFRAFRPTLVIIRDPDSAFGFLTLFATALGQAKPILYVQRPKYTSKPWQLVARRFSGAPIITPVLGDISPETIPNPNTYYVPFVMPTFTSPDEKQWFLNNQVNILSVGKFFSRKNHLLLLKAIRPLIGECFVNIVGEYRYESQVPVMSEINKYIDDEKIHSSISIKINIDYENMHILYPRNDLFILPSSNEPAAISPLEAMAHGLPVICSDTNGTRCYIVEGYNGYIFRSGDVEDLRDKIEKIIFDRSTVMKMGQRSYALVKHRHQPRYYVEAIEALAQGLPVDESRFLSMPEE